MDADHTAERALAAELDRARKHLMAAGATELPRFPWMAGRAPHDDMTLLRYAVWRTTTGAGTDAPGDLGAALRLVGSARAELDAMESGVLFLARAQGLTWPQIAEQLGVRSPQAAQQRFERVTSRADGS